MSKKICSTKKPKTYLQRIREIIGGGNKKIEIRHQPRSEFDVPGRFSLYKGNENVAYFYLQQLPGCCGVCLSHSTYIRPKYRNQGLGKLLNRMKQQLAWDNHFSILLATDKDYNTAQEKIFKKTGWNAVSFFKNRRTQNKVAIQVKVLKPTGYKIGATTPEGQPFKITW